jgi:hypothetical protein
MKEKKERHAWLLSYLDKLAENATDVITIESMDVLNANFVNNYIAATNAKFIAQPFGADKCPMLGSDLSELARGGYLRRTRTGLQGMGGMGFPRWVWSYTITPLGRSVVARQDDEG